MSSKNLSKHMRLARIKKKMSIDDLSKKLNIESKFLSDYEDGLRFANNKHYKAIRDALDISIGQ